MTTIRRLALAWLVPAALAAQQVPTDPLKVADGTVKGGFGNVMSMHELADGRVLMTDAMVGLVGTGNFSTGKFQSISNVNAGPMLPLAGDSSLTWNQREWVVLVGDKPIGMLPRDNPVVVASGGFVYGADSLGYVLAFRSAPTGTHDHRDSAAVVRIARTTAAQDTIAWLWEPAPGALRALYPVWEHARLMVDGWLAVLRTAPYRVDWRSPDGHWTLGKPIPVPIVKIDDREKLAYMAWRAPGQSPKTILSWPDAVEPWTMRYPPITSVDGKLLVFRTPTADFPETRYDVINRRGELERQVTMAANEKILGFGAKSVYVTVTAKDGGQSVERHPWP